MHKSVMLIGVAIFANVVDVCSMSEPNNKQCEKTNQILHEIVFQETKHLISLSNMPWSKRYSIGLWLSLKQKELLRLRSQVFCSDSPQNAIELSRQLVQDESYSKDVRVVVEKFHEFAYQDLQRTQSLEEMLKKANVFCPVELSKCLQDNSELDKACISRYVTLWRKNLVKNCQEDFNQMLQAFDAEFSDEILKHLS